MSNAPRTERKNVPPWDPRLGRVLKIPRQEIESEELKDYLNEPLIVRIIIHTASGHARISEGSLFASAFGCTAAYPSLILKKKHGLITRTYYHKSLVPIIAEHYFKLRNSSKKAAFHVPEEKVQIVLSDLKKQYPPID